MNDKNLTATSVIRDAYLYNCSGELLLRSLTNDMYNQWCYINDGTHTKGIYLCQQDSTPNPEYDQLVYDLSSYQGSGVSINQLSTEPMTLSNVNWLEGSYYLIVGSPMSDYNVKMTALADSVREKTSASGQLTIVGMKNAIDTVTPAKFTARTITPTTRQQTVLPSYPYNGFSSVTVTGIQTEEKTVTENGIVTPTSGKYLSKVTVNVPTTPTQSKTLTLGAAAPSTVTPDTGYALSSVPVELDTSVIKAENIAKDVQMLGITGTHEGGTTPDMYIEEIYDNEHHLINAVMHGNYTCIRESLFSPAYFTSFIIPDTVTEIQGYAFCGSPNLVSIDLPNGLTSLETMAFANCESLASITIPNSITSLSDGLFYECSGLTTASIPDSVTSIGYEAFYYCSSLASITIPDSVTSIGYEAFRGCASLTELTLPSSVTEFGSSAFKSCSSLTNVEIAAQNLGTGSTIFGSCSALKKAWFRSSCTTVTASTAKTAPFAGCPTALKIYCEADSKPSGYGVYFNRTGSNGATTVTVVYGQTTRPW